MTVDLTRVRAVAAAMRGIRDRLANGAADDPCSTAAYNKWIGMLDAAFEEGCEALTIDETEIEREELLAHLDAAIGFLDAYTA